MSGQLDPKGGEKEASCQLYSAIGQQSTFVGGMFGATSCLPQRQKMSTQRNASTSNFLCKTTIKQIQIY